MGLCNSERLNGLYYGINRINEQKKLLVHSPRDRSGEFSFTERKDLKALVAILDEMWNALIGNSNNSLHWLIGSSSSNEINGDPASPWEIAVVRHLELLDKKDHKFAYSDLNAFLDIEHLLEVRDKLAATVFRIYKRLEDITYYLRRYNDDFFKKNEKLNFLVSKANGECFNIFMKDDHFAKAYLLANIAEMLYGSLYPYKTKEDIVAALIEKNHLGKFIPKLMSLSLKEISVIHIKLTKVSVKAEKKYLNTEFQKIRLSCLLKYIYVNEKEKDIFFKDLVGSPLEKFIPHFKKELNKSKAVDVPASFEEKSKEDRLYDAFACYGSRVFDIIR